MQLPRTRLSLDPKKTGSLSISRRRLTKGNSPRARPRGRWVALPAAILWWMQLSLVRELCTGILHQFPAGRSGRDAPAQPWEIPPIRNWQMESAPESIIAAQNRVSYSL